MGLFASIYPCYYVRLKISVSMHACQSIRVHHTLPRLKVMASHKTQFIKPLNEKLKLIVWINYLISSLKCICKLRGHTTPGFSKNRFFFAFSYSFTYQESVCQRIFQNFAYFLRYEPRKR